MMKRKLINSLFFLFPFMAMAQDKGLAAPVQMPPAGIELNVCAIAHRKSAMSSRDIVQGDLDPTKIGIQQRQARRGKDFGQ